MSRRPRRRSRPPPAISRSASALSVDQPRARPVSAAPVAHRNLRRRLCRTLRRTFSSACRASSVSRATTTRSRPSSTISPPRVQALSTSPDSSAARYGVLTAAQTLAQHLNGMTADIQGLRSDAELGLSDAVNQANAAMRNIAAINRQLGLTNVQDATTATLQRPARLLHRPALAADGHQGGPDRPQPDQHLHPRRARSSSATARPRSSSTRKGSLIGGFAMGCRSEQALGRHAAARPRRRAAPST